VSLPRVREVESLWIPKTEKILHNVARPICLWRLGALP